MLNEFEVENINRVVIIYMTYQLINEQFLFVLNHHFTDNTSFLPVNLKKVKTIRKCFNVNLKMIVAFMKRNYLILLNEP